MKKLFGILVFMVFAATAWGFGWGTDPYQVETPYDSRGLCSPGAHPDDFTQWENACYSGNDPCCLGLLFEGGTVGANYVFTRQCLNATTPDEKLACMAKLADRAIEWAEEHGDVAYQKKIKDWILLEMVDNKYKFDPTDQINTSRSDFYFYKKIKR